MMAINLAPPRRPVPVRLRPRWRRLLRFPRLFLAHYLVLRRFEEATALWREPSPRLQSARTAWQLTWSALR
jgi:hypothetical protein